MITPKQRKLAHIITKELISIFWLKTYDQVWTWDELLFVCTYEYIKNFDTADYEIVENLTLDYLYQELK